MDDDTLGWFLVRTGDMATVVKMNNVEDVIATWLGHNTMPYTTPSNVG